MHLPLSLPFSLSPFPPLSLSLYYTAGIIMSPLTAKETKPLGRKKLFRSNQFKDASDPAPHWPVCNKFNTLKGSEYKGKHWGQSIL